MAGLLVLETAVPCSRLKPWWRLWAFPVPHPASSGTPQTAGTSVPSSQPTFVCELNTPIRESIGAGELPVVAAQHEKKRASMERALMRSLDVASSLRTDVGDDSMLSRSACTWDTYQPHRMQAGLHIRCMWVLGCLEMEASCKFCGHLKMMTSSIVAISMLTMGQVHLFVLVMCESTTSIGMVPLKALKPSMLQHML